MQDAARLQSQQQWVTDPNFRNTTLLLQADNAANSAQNNTFLDSSSNSFAITRNGNTTQGTFTPFSQGWSNYFNGANSDAIEIPNNAVFNFGTSDVTIEFWVNLTSTSAIQNLIDCGPSGGSGFTSWSFDITASGFIRFGSYVAGTYQSIEATNNALLPNQWYHVAFTRSSGTNRLFVNGASCTTTGTLTQAIDSGGNTVVVGRGKYSGFTRPSTGYFSNVRITKGGALYTSNFNPSTAPLTTTVSAGTVSLLTCQSNRFIDNSVNTFAVTVLATPSVQPFAPFAPQFQYTQGGIGGSGYFDGTGDFLSLASNAAFTVGTGNLTIEAWIYVTSLSQTFQGILSGRADVASNFPGLGLVIDNSQLFFTILNVGSGLRDSATVPLNQWVHVVGVRSGTNAALFVNGVRKASSTNSENGTSSDMVVGRYYPATNNYYFSGYISGARLVKGTAVYDPTQTTITVPTAPLTAITNTSLLLNFTNAGIIDGTMDNVLETVGNAQVSTSVVKYGSGSMYFDGTGDNLIAPDSENFRLGTGNFTIEFWINASASGTYNQVIGTLTSGTEEGTWRVGNRYNSTNSVYFARGTGSGFNEVVYTVNVNDGLWHHVACVRINGVIFMYVDGVAQTASSGSASIAGTCSSANRLWVGYNGRDNAYLTGYLDDVRVTKGVARYLSNFTPPQVALPRQ